MDQNVFNMHFKAQGTVHKEGQKECKSRRDEK